tara:strand:+ start:753 stop:1175 length:423 start_codon:yes stop_codon:yes gene_type:complete
MKNNIEKVYGKLPKKKVDLKKHKIALGLLDDFEYTSEFTNEIIGSLDYTVNNWFDEKFDQMMEIYNEIYDVYVNNSENYLKVVDIANDQRILDEILNRANDLGLEVADVYPEWYEHSDALEYLNGLEEKFNSQKDSLPNF